MPTQRMIFYLFYLSGIVISPDMHCNVLLALTRFSGSIVTKSGISKNFDGFQISVSLKEVRSE